jgi:uncharacterized membrane protein YfcA
MWAFQGKFYRYRGCYRLHRRLHTDYSLWHFATGGQIENVTLLFAATISAFLGAFIGNRLMNKVTMRTIQMLVSIMLFGIAVALGLGHI